MAEDDLRRRLERDEGTVLHLAHMIAAMEARLAASEHRSTNLTRTLLALAKRVDGLAVAVSRLEEAPDRLAPRRRASRRERAPSRRR